MQEQVNFAFYLLSGRQNRQGRDNKGGIAPQHFLRFGKFWTKSPRLNDIHEKTEDSRCRQLQTCMVYVCMDE